MTTKIEWTQETWNPIVGCSKISPGCVNCYAMTAANHPRLQQYPQYQSVAKWDGTIEFVQSQLNKPTKWRSPKRIFVCSMSDLFHPNVSHDQIRMIMNVIRSCPQHTFQVLTKRPDKMAEFFEISGENSYTLPNLWVGTSVEDSKSAKARIPILAKIPAAIRFLSCEPLLEMVDLSFMGKEIDWVIVGGESGPDARPCQIKWIEGIVQDCKNSKIPVFVKQLGSFFLDDPHSILYPKLKGKRSDFDLFPDAVRYREFPKLKNA